MYFGIPQNCDFLIRKEPIFPKIPCNGQYKYLQVNTAQMCQLCIISSTIDLNMLEITSLFVKAISPVRADFFLPMPSTHLSLCIWKPLVAELSQWCWGDAQPAYGGVPSTLLPTVSLPPLLCCSFCCSVSKEGEYLQEIHILPEILSLVVQWENFPFFLLCLCAEYTSRQLEHWLF